MTNYFGQRSALYRSPLQEKALPLFALSLATLLSGATVLYLFASPASAPATSGPIVVERPEELVDVLVPIRDIDENTLLDMSLFRVEKRPANYISPRVIRSGEAVQNQFARSFIAAGEPLHSGYLSARRFSAGESIARAIPKGFRLVTIRVDDTQSNDGLVRPGAVVDVSWVRKDNGVPTVSFIVQNAKVFVADKQIEQGWKPGMPVPATITLLVTAEDFKKVELAKTIGKLGLALRGIDGIGIGDTGGEINANDLAGQKAAPAPPAPCKDKVSFCKAPGDCEKMCLLADGSLGPVQPEAT